MEIVITENSSKEESKSVETVGKEGEVCRRRMGGDLEFKGVVVAEFGTKAKWRAMFGNRIHSSLSINIYQVLIIEVSL